MLESSAKHLLHADFFDAAVAAPEKIALQHNGASTTCGALAVQARRAAGGLQQAGIKPGDCVGINADRSIESVAVMLGALACGAAVLPLPRSYPLQKLREIVRFASPALVISDDASGLEEDTPTITLSRLLESTHPFEQPDLAPNQPAFVLSSSGTTGKPKLIVRSHESFYHRLEWTWLTLPFAPGERCVQKAHMTTTHSIYELFEPLLRGVELHIIDDEMARSVETFWQQVDHLGIQRLLIVPSFLRATLADPNFVSKNVRTLILMGEPVPAALARETTTRFPQATTIASIYGSTEASSCLLCDLRAHLDEDPLPIGQPISDEIVATVITDQGVEAGPGESGELYLSGTALFNEYLHDAELTAQSLISRGVDNRVYFATNDRVSVNESGEIIYAGRADDTVKIRGFRVDLGEVEAALGTVPSVQQAAVVVERATGGDARLIAFAVPESVPVKAVTQALRKALPEYMVPAFVRAVAEIPRTASAKVDRQALIESHLAALRNRSAESFASPIEEAIATAWTATLDFPPSSAEQNFFEAGGTSLSVFTLIRQLRTALPDRAKKINDAAIYANPSVAQLASYLAQDVAATAEASPLVMLRAGSSGTALYLVSPAGGTLGAYQEVIQHLVPAQPVIGIRDPYISGERDGTESFQTWVAHYVRALRERQPDGPYWIAGYSSAGAFAIEVAQQLVEAGQTVARLFLIDTLALEYREDRPFGRLALRYTYMRSQLQLAVRLFGKLRAPLMRLSGKAGFRSHPSDCPIGAERLSAIQQRKLAEREHLLFLSSLIELNSGERVAIDAHELDDIEESSRFSFFCDRIQSRLPDLDAEALQRTVVQYGLQIRCQQQYELSRYDGPTTVFEAQSRYSGIVALQLQPYFRELESVILPMSDPDQRTVEISHRFGAMAPHYRSIRDRRFAQALAGEIASRMPEQ